MKFGVAWRKVVWLSVACCDVTWCVMVMMIVTFLMKTLFHKKFKKMKMNIKLSKNKKNKKIVFNKKNNKTLKFMRKKVDTFGAFSFFRFDSLFSCLCNPVRMRRRMFWVKFQNRES